MHIIPVFLLSPLHFLPSEWKFIRENRMPLIVLKCITNCIVLITQMCMLVVLPCPNPLFWGPLKSVNIILQFAFFTSAYCSSTWNLADLQSKFWSWKYTSWLTKYCNSKIFLLGCPCCKINKHSPWNGRENRHTAAAVQVEVPRRRPQPGAEHWLRPHTGSKGSELPHRPCNCTFPCGCPMRCLHYGPQGGSASLLPPPSRSPPLSPPRPNHHRPGPRPCHTSWDRKGEQILIKPELLCIIILVFGSNECKRDAKMWPAKTTTVPSEIRNVNKVGTDADMSPYRAFFMQPVTH